MKRHMLVLSVAVLTMLPMGALAQQSANSEPPARKASTRHSTAKREVDSGKKTPTGKTIYVGPRGGGYHYSKSGKKVYERHRR